MDASRTAKSYDKQPGKLMLTKGLICSYWKYHIRTEFIRHVLMVQVLCQSGGRGVQTVKYKACQDVCATLERFCMLTKSQF